MRKASMKALMTMRVAGQPVLEAPVK
jgi:hypothetical protein